MWTEDEKFVIPRSVFVNAVEAGVGASDLDTSERESLRTFANTATYSAINTYSCDGTDCPAAAVGLFIDEEETPELIKFTSAFDDSIQAYMAHYDTKDALSRVARFLPFVAIIED